MSGSSSGRDPRLLIVESDALLLGRLAEHLGATFEVRQAGSPETVDALLHGGDVDLVLLDTRLSPQTHSIEAGLAVASRIRERSPGTLTIALGDHGDRESILRAAETGVYDILFKPIDIRELDLALRRALDRRRLDDEVRRLREELRHRFGFKNFVGNSPSVRAVKETIRRVADSSASVLIRGESGTGKELVARTLHFNSARKDGPFVALNCSAFPVHLVEGELFGHASAAAGAGGAREGRLEMAAGGTLFLDEPGALTPSTQARLNRAIETGIFESSGGRNPIRIDIRLVCATSQNLGAEVRAGRFLKDLHRRIGAVSITLPPLRRRPADIPVLAEHFLERFCRENNKRRKRLSPDVVEHLLSLEWRGNVRELEHTIESLVLLTEGEMITRRDLPLDTGRAPGSTVPEGGILLEKTVADFERGLLSDALRRSRGVKKDAAAMLGLNKDQMKYLCRKYNL